MYASTLPRSNWLRRASIRLAWYRHMPASSLCTLQCRRVAALSTVTANKLLKINNKKNKQQLQQRTRAVARNDCRPGCCWHQSKSADRRLVPRWTGPACTSKHVKHSIWITTSKCAVNLQSGVIIRHEEDWCMVFNPRDKHKIICNLFP